MRHAATRTVSLTPDDLRCRWCGHGSVHDVTAIRHLGDPVPCPECPGGVCPAPAYRHLDFAVHPAWRKR